MQIRICLGCTRFGPFCLFFVCGAAAAQAKNRQKRKRKRSGSRFGRTNRTGENLFLVKGGRTRANGVIIALESRDVFRRKSRKPPNYAAALRRRIARPARGGRPLPKSARVRGQRDGEPFFGLANNFLASEGSIRTPQTWGAGAQNETPVVSASRFGDRRDGELYNRVGDRRV